MNKKALSLILAAVMLFACFAIVAIPADAHAAVAGTTLFKKDKGAVQIESGTQSGVEVAFAEDSGDVSSVKYAYTADVQKFSLKWKFSDFSAEKTFLTLTDVENTTVYLTLELTQKGEKLEAVLKDNWKNESAVTEISAVMTDELTFSYDKSGVFKVNDVTLNADTIRTKAFENNEATLSFGVNKQEESKTSKVTLLSMENVKGVQSLLADAVKVDTLLKYKKGLDETQTSFTVKSALDQDFVFPVYGVSILGNRLRVKYKEPSDTEFGNENVGKTKHKLTQEGTYVFKIYTETEDNAVTFTVTAVKDTSAPKFEEAALRAALADLIAQQNVSAPSLNNTYRFPSIDAAVAADPDGIDTLYNIKVQVGYKKPGETGEFTFANGLDVSLNTVGVWSFEYKLTDAAGNKTESKDIGVTFKLNVIDTDAPVIDMPEVKEISVDKEFVFSEATMKDNASGVNSVRSSFKVFRIEDGDRTDVTDELKKADFKIKPTVLTDADGNHSYEVEYTAFDNAGNKSTHTMKVKVVTPKAEDPKPNPTNDALQTTLIVIASLCGLGIVVLLFVKPKKPEQNKK